MLTLSRLRAALLLLVVASSSAVAEKLDPPTMALGESTTTIVVADYQEAGPANRIVFAKVKVLQSRAEVPDLIDLAKPDLREALVSGKRYIIAYSPYAEDRFERLTVNPRGASFLSSPGIEPGLWLDSAENQAMVMWRIGDPDAEQEREQESGRDSGQDTEAAVAAMPRLLKMLAANDRQHREFAAAEIAYRPALVAELDASDQKALQRFVASDIGPDRSRAALLNVAAAMPAKPAAIRGWNAVVTNLLANTPVATLGADRRSSLILAALAYPPGRKQHTNGTLQARWLRSDDMGVVDAAAMVLQEMSVELARKRIGEVLADAKLPADNRTLLDGYQRRLDLMEAGPN